MAKALDSNPPKTVEVKIYPVYEGNSIQPTSFDIEHKIDNGRWEIREFENKPGGIIELNEDKLNEFYQKLANTINEIIPEEWSKVFLYGEIGEGTGTAFFFYSTHNNDQLIYSHDIPEIFSISRLEYRGMWRKLIKSLKELSEEFKK